VSSGTLNLTQPLFSEGVTNNVDETLLVLQTRNAW